MQTSFDIFLLLLDYFILKGIKWKFKVQNLAIHPGTFHVSASNDAQLTFYSDAVFLYAVF